MEDRCLSCETCSTIISAGGSTTRLGTRLALLPSLPPGDSELLRGRKGEPAADLGTVSVSPEPYSFSRIFPPIISLVLDSLIKFLRSRFCSPFWALSTFLLKVPILFWTRSTFSFGLLYGQIQTFFKPNKPILRPPSEEVRTFNWVFLSV